MAEFRAGPSSSEPTPVTTATAVLDGAAERAVTPCVSAESHIFEDDASSTPSITKLRLAAGSSRQVTFAAPAEGAEHSTAKEEGDMEQQRKQERLKVGDFVIVARARQPHRESYLGMTGRVILDDGGDQPFQIEGAGSHRFWEDELQILSQSIPNRIGVGTQLLAESLLAVQIPDYSAEGAFSGYVSFNIKMDYPHGQEIVTKTYSDFMILHQELSDRPYADSLPALPPDRAFANFDSAFLEQRRQQLESYLSFLCMHTIVLLDGILWAWLALSQGNTTKLVSNLVVHDLLGCVEDVVFELEVLALSLRTANAGSRRHALVQCCRAPVVAPILVAQLLDKGAADGTLLDVCYVMGFLVSCPATRRRCLPAPPVGLGGLAALLVAFARGGVVAAAVQEVLETVVMADAAEHAGAITAATSASLAAGPDFATQMPMATQLPTPVEERPSSWGVWSAWMKNASAVLGKQQASSERETFETLVNPSHHTVGPYETTVVETRWADPCQTIYPAQTVYFG